MSNAYIKNEHWTFFAKQNRKKGKTVEISLKMNYIDFEVWPVNKRFCKRG